MAINDDGILINHDLARRSETDNNILHVAASTRRMLLREPLDPGAPLGHCGATSYGVSDCKGGSQGSFGLDFRHGPSSVMWHRAARRCLERCALCCS